MVAQKVTGTK